MKPIRIDIENRSAIEAALKEVNGTATAHTFTDCCELVAMASEAEAAARHLLNAADLPGARYTETSGGAVAKKYRNSRKATTVTIERRSKGWFLVAVASTEIWEKGGGAGRLVLTPEQDVAARNKFATRYSVAA